MSPEERLKFWKKASEDNLDLANRYMTEMFRYRDALAEIVDVCECQGSTYHDVGKLSSKMLEIVKKALARKEETRVNSKEF